MDWPQLIVFLIGAFAASLANGAVYAWAWNYRRISPWQATPEGVAQRTWLDRIPIFGWLRLRRDAKVLGRGFWIRPLMVELSFAIAMVWLYRWEVNHLGLLGFNDLGIKNLPTDLQSYAFYGFLFHAVLAFLMLIASLIDVDEKTIPDEVTVPGTLLGLIMATLLPKGLLPTFSEQAITPPIAIPYGGVGTQAVGPNGDPLWLNATHLASPNGWPELLANSNHLSLLIGIACFWLWCFALTPRRWHISRGMFFGLMVVLRRVSRTLRMTPLREILIAGTLWIATVWSTGGDAWVGLMTSLVGMALSGGMIWAVRIVGSTALGKEAMGFGDVTLMMMVGAFIGWQAGLMTFFLAPFAGIVIGILQLVLRHDDVIPYGPFLCLGTAFVVVQWNELWARSEAIFSHGTLLPAVLIIGLILMGVLLGIWRVIKTQLLGISES